MSRARLMTLGLCALLLAPAPVGGQAGRQATVQVGVAQALARDFTAARGPGVRAAFTLPRTHNVDAGLDAGFFDLGRVTSAFSGLDPLWGPVTTTTEEEQRFGWIALLARLHLAEGRVRPVASATVGLYGYAEREVFDERTPSGAPVRAGRLEFTDMSWAPGLGLGLGVEWGRPRGLAMTAALQVHGAFFRGFPVATLGVGVGYR